MECSLCHKEEKTLGHHLSYDPEIVMVICYRCHVMLHKLAELSVKEREQTLQIVGQYGNNWDNGKDKYRYSERRKSVMRVYSQTPERKQQKITSKKTAHARMMGRRWYKEHRKHHPEVYEAANQRRREKKACDKLTRPG